MYCGREFDVSEADENEVYGFDFINDLANGETITGATFSIAVKSGTDPTPNARLSGGPFLTSTTIAVQRIVGLLNGVVYIVKCLATTTSGNTISLFSHIRGRGTW